MRPALSIAVAVLLAAVPAAAQAQAPGTPHGNPGAAASSGSLDQGVRQTLERLAADAVAAKQASIRATDKHTARTVELLGDHIALTQGELSRRLAAMAGGGIGSDARMSDEATRRVQQLNGLNGRPFAEQYVAFVGEVYPRMIRDLEQTSRGGNADLRGLADSVLPKMREEMAAIDRLKQGAFDDQQLARELERDLTPARKDAQTFSRPNDNAQGSGTAPTAGSSSGDQTGGNRPAAGATGSTR
ncbi:MAG TPA: DUF4142 domain-containing protein [Azospirillum sp.]|nr:DUF4142 domain-containing protein [Azospirillum sp.]